MKREFQLSCESTVDLPYSYVNGRNIKVLFYTYLVDGKELLDDMGQDENTIKQFYKYLDEGKFLRHHNLMSFNMKSFLEIF